MTYFITGLLLLILLAIPGGAELLGNVIRFVVGVAVWGALALGVIYLVSA